MKNLVVTSLFSGIGGFEAGFQTAGALSQQKREALGRDSNVYELIEPVLQIAPNGYVEHV